MREDTIHIDSLESRPLPKWLTDQKEGLTTYKPREIVVKEDSSLEISFFITLILVLIVVAILTLMFKRRNKFKLK